MILGLILIVSLAVNVILFWYTRKIVQRLSFGVDNVDQLQNLLEEYCQLLEGMLELDQYYGDDTINGAVRNTKLVIQTCKTYKKTILEEEYMDKNDNNESNSEG